MHDLLYIGVQVLGLLFVPFCVLITFRLVTSTQTPLSDPRAEDARRARLQDLRIVLLIVFESILVFADIAINIAHS
jgi:hypothetical protein